MGHEVIFPHIFCQKTPNRITYPCIAYKIVPLLKLLHNMYVKRNKYIKLLHLKDCVTKPRYEIQYVNLDIKISNAHEVMNKAHIRTDGIYQLAIMIFKIDEKADRSKYILHLLLLLCMILSIEMFTELNLYNMKLYHEGNIFKL